MPCVFRLTSFSPLSTEHMFAEISTLPAAPASSSAPAPGHELCRTTLVAPSPAESSLRRHIQAGGTLAAHGQL